MWDQIGLGNDYFDRMDAEMNKVDDSVWAPLEVPRSPLEQFFNALSGHPGKYDDQPTGGFWGSLGGAKGPR